MLLLGIIENCLSAVKSHLKLLVLDERSKKIMSSAVKMVDLTTAGISRASLRS
jgi:hypothetical protein